MRAAIFNPYLDTLGGGERYSMAVAQTLIKKGFQVEVQWRESLIKQRLERRFGINLQGVKIVRDIRRGEDCEVCFWVSDGSIPLLRARKNFLHFQVPFHDTGAKTLINKAKLFRIKKVICNSKFTKSFIDKEYGIKSAVIYPPVDVVSIKPKKKEFLIIYVGRFSQLTQSKKQDELIKAFKTFYDSGNKKWKMVLAGGVEVGVGTFLERISKLAKGYPIRIFKSPSYREIKELYARAKFFWSASGFGVNQREAPEKLEHFGISLVEAMAAGAVPIAFAAGGHLEIIQKAQNGYLWTKKSALINLTQKLVKDEKLWRNLSQKANQSAQKYSYECFEKEFLKFL